MNKPEITNKKLEELKQLAEAATPGPWFVIGAGSNAYAIGAKTKPLETLIISSYYSNEEMRNYGLTNKLDATYIAAASPDFILALIEDDMQLLRENRRLSNEITKLNKMVDWFAAKMPLSEHDDNRQEDIDRWKEIARTMTR